MKGETKTKQPDSYCVYCGRRMSPGRSGRRRYCNNSCRQSEYRFRLRVTAAIGERIKRGKDDMLENHQTISKGKKIGIDSEGETMSDDTFTIGEITSLLKCHERAARKLLTSAGAELDIYKIDPAELVNREAVIDLLAIRAGDRVGRLLGDLLSGRVS